MAQHHGSEVCTEGDAFLVAFHTPEDACAWCVDVQQVLPITDSHADAADEVHTADVCKATLEPLIMIIL